MFDNDVTKPADFSMGLCKKISGNKTIFQCKSYNFCVCGNIMFSEIECFRVFTRPPPPPDSSLILNSLQNPMDYIHGVFARLCVPLAKLLKYYQVVRVKWSRPDIQSSELLLSLDNKCTIFYHVSEVEFATIQSECTRLTVKSDCLYGLSVGR